MAEKVKIVEMDMDINALISKAAQSKDAISNLQRTIKGLKDEQKVHEQAIIKSQEALRLLTEAGKGSSAEAEKLRKFISDDKDAVNSFNKELVENEARLKSLQKEYRTQTSVIQAYSDKHLKELDVIKQTDGSISQLQSALAQNRNLYRNLTKEERENADIGGKLLGIINIQDKEYKELSKSIGITQVEVGNYKEQVKEALKESFNLENSLRSILGPFSMFSGLVVSSTKQLYAWAVGNKAAATATGATSNALKLLRIALISTGIGAIVVVIGSLISYLTSTQEGIDSVNKVLTPLKVVFQSTFGVIQKVGKALFETFSNPKQAMKDLYEFVKNNLINRFKAFGVILDGIINLDFKKVADGVMQAGTGVENMTDKIKNAGKQTTEFLDEAWKRGKEIENIAQKLSRTEADFILQQGKLKEQFAEQNYIAKDTSKTAKERETAAIASIKTLKDINKLTRDRNELEVKLLQLKAQSNDTSDAERAEIAQKVVELNAANAEMLKAETKQNKILNSIRKEEAAKEKAARDERTKAAEESYNKILAAQQKSIDKTKVELETYIATNSAIAQSLAERLTLEENARNQRLKILEDETALKIKQAKGDAAEIAKIRAESNKEQISINQEYFRTQAELTTQAAQNELQIWVANNQSRIENNTRLNDELVNQEESRLKTIYDKTVESLDKTKAILEEAGLFDYQKKQEYDLAKLQAEQQYQESKKEIETTYQTQKSDDEKLRTALEFEERLLSLEEQNATEFELQQELALQNYENEKADLEAQREEGKISEENYQLALDGIRKKYALSEKKINEELSKYRLSLMSQTYGAIADLFGQETALGKAAAISQIMVDTIMKSQEAFATAAALSANPFTAALAPWAYAQAGLITASGAAAAAKVGTASKKKAAKGITLSGPSHAGGGIDLFDRFGNHIVEAEGNENVYVLNKRASKEIAALSGLNQTFGGVPLHSTTKHAATGGMIRNIVSNGQVRNANIDSESIGMAMAPFIAEAVKQGSLEGSVIGTHTGAKAGVEERRINNEISKAASH